MTTNKKIVYNADGVAFTIYELTKSTKAGRTKYWLLVDRSTGKRRVLNNPSLEAAQRRADEIRAAMAKGQVNRLALTHGQWQEVCIAFEIVRRHRKGQSLIEAVQEWCDCTDLLKGKATLAEAALYYLSKNNDDDPGFKPTRFADAAEAYHAFKVKAGKSTSHCDNIESRLNRLQKELPDGVHLHELTTGQLEIVIVGLGLSEKTRNEYIILLNNFYRWAEKQNPSMVPMEFNPARTMERHKVRHREVQFVHVADLKKILEATQGKRSNLTRVIVLVSFGALRPSEALRLDWKEIGDEYIRLPGNKSKTGYSRQIPISLNLKAWLAAWRKEEGPVCSDVSLEHLNTAIRRVSGVCVPYDGLRHGYGTHRQVIVQNIGTVSSEMGNSPQICRRHYLNAFCTKEEAEAWFSIMPEPSNNMIPLPTTPQLVGPAQTQSGPQAAIG